MLLFIATYQAIYDILPTTGTVVTLHHNITYGVALALSYATYTRSQVGPQLNICRDETPRTWTKATKESWSDKTNRLLSPKSIAKVWLISQKMYDAEGTCSRMECCLTLNTETEAWETLRRILDPQILRKAALGSNGQNFIGNYQICKPKPAWYYCRLKWRSSIGVPLRWKWATSRG